MPRPRLLSPLVLLAILLGACLPTVSPPPPTLPATFLPRATFTPLPPTATATLAPTETRPEVSRVLILSIDGLRPDAIPQAPMPVLLNLIQAGAYSLVAQTIYPSGTLPAHASMLSGLCPHQHAVNWNDYDPSQGYALGTDLFDLAHAAGLRTVMVVGKEKLQQVTEPSSLDHFTYINDRDLVITEYVVREIIPVGFGVLFIHFPTADWMGHEYGWLSPEYLSVLRRADEALGNLLAALQASGLRERTLIIVTADHGGHGFLHGTTQPEDMTIPWVINGPGVLPGGLGLPINITDTAATAAWALNLTLPPEWQGIPVYEAFGQESPPRAEPRCP
ncbi:MAG: alkaline phosphatase family protein [Anaerolineales bacterium]|nr:alkaline phosphatase family protein [Anaerolineales bacterium]